MAGGVVRVVPGRHIRRAELEGVRRVSLAALIMLVVQYGLGIILNLYIAVPASDAHAGLMQEIASGPLMLTVHALLGLALIGAALVLLVRAVRLGDRVIAVLGGPDCHRRGVRVGRDLRAQRSVGCFAGHGPADRGGTAVLHRRADLGQHRSTARLRLWLSTALLWQRRASADDHESAPARPLESGRNAILGQPRGAVRNRWALLYHPDPGHQHPQHRGQQAEEADGTGQAS